MVEEGRDVAGLAVDDTRDLFRIVWVDEDVVIMQSLCQRHGLVMAASFGMRALKIFWYHAKAVSLFSVSGW